MKLLVAEDEPKTGIYLQKGLTEAGFSVDRVITGIDALQLVLDRPYDLLILDVMMPGLNGWDVLRKIRAAGVNMPVLFLSARDGVEDRVKGLDLGADDYMVKPFAFSELLARVRVLLCRANPPSSQTHLVIGDLELDLIKHQAFRGGKRIDLTANVVEQKSPRSSSLVRLPLNMPGVHTRLLFEESLVVALPQDHPLCTQRRIKPQELAGCPMLVLARKFAPGLYDQMLAGFHRRKVTLTIAREMGEFTTQLALVAAGLGVGILPSGAASALPVGVVTRPLALPMSGAGIGVAWLGLENPRKQALMKVLDELYPTPGSELT